MAAPRPGAIGRINVRGLNELVRAFKDMPDAVVEEFVWELEEAAGPVKLAAQAKAPGSMSGMGKPTRNNKAWRVMRVGVARQAPPFVYVVPDLRHGRLRKQSEKQKEAFTTGLQTRALDPALAENTPEVERRIEDFLDRIADHHGF